ncbi:MAG: VWA domain-containing protein [Dehalococcoidia bacterium]|nr:VWA domain-containing protein [Dehalococcoidia bacterium]
MRGLRGLLRRLAAEEHGIAIILTTMLMTAMLGMTALTVDVTRFFTLQRELQNAADAAAHASAQRLPDIGVAQATAYEYFDLNKLRIASGEINDCPPGESTCIDVTFPPGTDARVHIEAVAVIPSTFGKLFGVSGVTVRREAEARSSPRDVVLALDRSGSMCNDAGGGGGGGNSTGPWQPFTSVQNAAVNFANLFAPQYDQLGLTSYATTSTLDQPLTHNFGPGTPYNAAIMGLKPQNTTNIGYTLYQARCELLSARSRPDAVRVIVLLTDGVPNIRNTGSLSSCGVSPGRCQPAGSPAPDPRATRSLSAKPSKRTTPVS